MDQPESSPTTDIRPGILVSGKAFEHLDGEQIDALRGEVADFIAARLEVGAEQVEVVPVIDLMRAERPLGKQGPVAGALIRGLTALRRRIGKTQMQIADATPLYQRNVSYLENGKSEPGIMSAHFYLKGLGYRLGMLAIKEPGQQNTPWPKQRGVRRNRRER
jgi:hypothetical protein